VIVSIPEDGLVRTTRPLWEMHAMFSEDVLREFVFLEVCAFNGLR
jgi:hypothetical protein